MKLLVTRPMPAAAEAAIGARFDTRFRDSNAPLTLDEADGAALIAFQGGQQKRNLVGRVLAVAVQCGDQGRTGVAHAGAGGGRSGGFCL